MYTGDDFNYAELIAGDEQGHSDALLGIFDAIAPAASAALAGSAAGDEAGFHEILAPDGAAAAATSSRRRRASTRRASCSSPGSTACRTISPWSAASRARARIVHLAELFRLADEARVLRDPDLAARRMKRLLAVHGIA